MQIAVSASDAKLRKNLRSFLSPHSCCIRIGKLHEKIELTGRKREEWRSMLCCRRYVATTWAWRLNSASGTTFWWQECFPASVDTEWPRCEQAVTPHKRVLDPWTHLWKKEQTYVQENICKCFGKTVMQRSWRLWKLALFNASWAPCHAFHASKCLQSTGKVEHSTVVVKCESLQSFKVSESPGTTSKNFVSLRNQSWTVYHRVLFVPLLTHIFTRSLFLIGVHSSSRSTRNIFFWLNWWLCPACVNTQGKHCNQKSSGGG